MKKGTKASQSVRLLRVGESIRHALSSIIQRGELIHDDLQDVSITVTAAEVTSDLRTAKIYVVPLGGKNADTIIRALNDCSGFLRGQLGRVVTFKFTPKLHFKLDTSFDEADHITRLLSDPKVKKDLDPS